MKYRIELYRNRPQIFADFLRKIKGYGVRLKITETGFDPIKFWSAPEKVKVKYPEVGVPEMFFIYIANRPEPPVKLVGETMGLTPPVQFEALL